MLATICIGLSHYLFIQTIATLDLQGSQFEARGYLQECESACPQAHKTGPPRLALGTWFITLSQKVAAARRGAIQKTSQCMCVHKGCADGRCA